MRFVIAAVALALAMGVALAQGVGKGKRGRQNNAATKTEDAAKKKADEDAYKKALQSIPDATQKIDPWKGVR